MSNEQETAITVSQGERWVSLTYRLSIMTIVFLSAAYALSPVDVIPDMLIGPGQVDDAAAIGAGVGTAGMATFLRFLMMYIMQRPLLRTGCFVFVGVALVGFVMATVVVFIALYSLIEQL